VQHPEPHRATPAGQLGELPQHGGRALVLDHTDLIAVELPDPAELAALLAAADRGGHGEAPESP
jgi:hypothetical protein